MNPSPSHQSSDTLYLEKLEFRPELRKTWLNFFVVNFRVVVLLMILITIWGVSAYLKLPRERDPEVKIPMAVVSSIYPGASPSDVEELVTKKLETSISGIKGIKEISSSSANSFSAITVEFNSNEDLDDAIRRLRDEVKSSIKDLPEEVDEPTVTEISMDDTPIWTISLTGPFDGLTMRKYAEDLQDELEKIPSIREVKISGGDEREFEIAYDPQKLVILGLTPDQVNTIVKATNVAIPSGAFDGTTYTYAVRSDSRFYTADAIAAIPVTHTDDGSLIKVGDLARVSEKAIKKTIYSRLSKEGSAPQEAVTLQIIKKVGGSVLDTTAQAKTTIETMMAKFPAGMSYAVSLDQAKMIQRNFDQLVHDFTMTIILVFTILFLIVGFKEALVAGLAVPLTFFVTFGVMNLVGITLNFLSIFSLLLALGLLVDDAIVVVSATKQYLKTGKFTPEEAVLLVLNDFKVVLTTTTLTTVWAFLPLLMATGIIGSYLKSIPITVSVILISSLLIALMINHPLAAVLERIRFTKNLFLFSIACLIGTIFLCLQSPSWLSIILAVLAAGTLVWLVRWYRRGGNKVLAQNKSKSEREWKDDEMIKKKLREQGSHEEGFWSRLMHGIINFHAITPLYEKFLRWTVLNKKIRTTVIAGILALFIFSISLPVVGIVKTEFFPASDFEYFFVNVEAPIGMKLSETDKIVKRVEEQLLKYPEVTNYSTIVGRAASSSRLSAGGNTTSHLASVTVNLVDKENRKLRSYELADQVRQDLAFIKDATITVDSPRGGPPSGSAFEAQISGEDLQTLDKIAHDLLPYVKSIPGVVDPAISLKESSAEYTFALDPIKMEFYNLNAAYVGSTLRMAIAGTDVTKVVREGKEIKVIANFDEKLIPRLEDVQNIQILNTRKQPVFLKDVLKTELKPSVNSITRIDQKRVVTLSADVTGDTRANEVVTQFQKKVTAEYKMPEGYTIKFGGENETNEESVLSIITAMQVAFVLIISTLVIQFNSFKKTFIVLCTIPLALIGVFLGLAVTGITLSFPGLIGILALFGIVVKNAIILVDKINLNIRAGIPFDESIIDAGKSRLEAIFITSICTIAGLIPITLSNEQWTALGSAVIFGLMLSSFFTLFMVPVLYKSIIGRKFNT